MEKKITIGADPEFMIAVPGTELQYLSAGEVFGGYNIKDKRGNYGTDSVSSVAEIRPDPSTNTREVIDNIRHLLKVMDGKCPDAVFLAGPFHGKQPIGGHIHFGVNIDDKLRDLDMLISAPLYLLVNKEKILQRYCTGYGDFSQIQYKEWGTEYRTPYSWLIDPDMSFAVLDIAQHIIENKLNICYYTDLRGHRENNNIFDYINRDYIISYLKKLQCKGAHMFIDWLTHFKEFNVFEDFKPKWKLPKTKTGMFKVLNHLYMENLFYSDYMEELQNRYFNNVKSNILIYGVKKDISGKFIETDVKIEHDFIEGPILYPENIIRDNSIKIYNNSTNPRKNKLIKKMSENNCNYSIGFSYELREYINEMDNKEKIFADIINVIMKEILNNEKGGHHVGYYQEELPGMYI